MKNIRLALCTIFTVFAFGHAALADEPPPLAAPAKDPKIAENIAAQAQFQVWLGAKKFDELDRVANGLLNQYHNKLITADELSERLQLIASNNPKIFIPDFEAWVKERPKSYAAHFLLGVEYLVAGKQARGSKLANDTSDAQFAEMDRFMQKAKESLLRSIPLDTKPYPSYRALVTIEGMTGDGKGCDQAFRSAVKTDPDAPGVYLKYLEFNSPRWGGSYEFMDGVVEAAKSTSISLKNLRVIQSEVFVWKARDEAGFNKNPSRSADYWLEAYQLNPGKSQVGHLYASARQAKEAKQIDRAIKIYTQITNEFKTEDNAYFQRGDLQHQEKQNYKLAFDDFLAAAKLGNKYGQNNVGYYYMTGKAGVTDLKLARTYLQLSADQGFEHAKEKLKLLDKM